MTAEARAEAERRYPAPNFPGDNIGLRVGFVDGAEWKGAQVKMALIELRDYFHRHGLPQQEAIAVRALSVVESSDEVAADGE